MAREKVSEYVKLQRSREARLWIAQTATIIGGVIFYLETHPEVKDQAKARIEEFKNRFRKKVESNEEAEQV